MSLKSVNHVQFGTFTDEEWRAFSVVKVTKPVNRGNQNMSETPYDLRLGALENGVPCETCGEKNNICPGHFGHIDLGEYIYSPIYMLIVLNIVKCICIKCFNPRIPENSVEINMSQKKKNRFTSYRKKAETIKQCTTCMYPLPTFFIDKYVIKMFFDDKRKAVAISAREMRTILSQISSKTMNLLGFNEDLASNTKFKDDYIQFPTKKNHVHEIRPESFILGVLPVLPPCARPWIIRDGERKDDDITDAYNIILKINNKLITDETKKGQLTESGRRKAVEDLTINIWTLFDASKTQKKNTSRQIKGLSNRLKGKDGHFQYNVGGKRVDFSARTPIIPGGSIVPMGWIGIPEQIAKVETIPELVLGWNFDYMTKLLKEDKINAIVRQGRTIPISKVTGKGEDFEWNGEKGLKHYDIVHRQLQHGDWGMFNRQPTLRIESMQGVQVMILPPEEKAFRIPLGMTRAFNADCDGDEMNLHIAQVQGARIECSTISRTAYQLISAQNCAPVMGCVQNTLVCNYILTETFMTPGLQQNKPNYTFPEDTAPTPEEGYQTLVDTEDFIAAMKVANIDDERYKDLLMRAHTYYPKYIKKSGASFTPKKKIPGKLVVSIVFPRTFTWQRNTNVNERLPLVKIENGIIHPDSGPICKKTIGGCSASAIHALWKISPDTAMNVITELQFMTTVLITRIGFSMGISDCIPLEYDEIKKSISEALIKCEIINSSGKDAQDKELDINSALNEALGVAPRLAKTSMNKKDRNALVIMKKSGAKGSDMNNGQISGFVGPQSIDGKRMPFTLSDNRRALPHFQFGDNSPEARGFVKHSFLEGLTFQEVWFHAAAGRRGVVDTAMKSVTGDTELLIESGGVTSVVTIGKWIDQLIVENIGQVEINKKANAQHLQIEGILPAPVYIPTVDDLGNVGWGLVTEITRHEPTEILYLIKTKLGRHVTVADSKSLLIYNFRLGRLDQTDMKDVKVGYYVPVTRKLPNPPGGPIKGSYRETQPLGIRLAKANLKGLNTSIDWASDKNGKILIIPDKYVTIFGNVILDEIISIEPLIGLNHKYVYDLTVPSTTNFCLANGLHVVDTADSGYIQKKIVKKIEDCKVTHDGTIRDANGSIIQFLYGGDGMNPKELSPVKNVDQPIFADLHFIADQLNSEAFLKKAPGKPRVLTREEVDLLVSFIQSGSPGFQSEVTERATFNIKTIIRRCMVNLKIYECMIPMFCRKVKDEYENAKAKMGYMAGLIAASSMGEPTTQLTLNSFHFTGQSSKDVTLGVPRLKELLNATKKPSKPSCTIFLKDKKLQKYVSDEKSAGPDAKDINKKGLERVTQLSSKFAYRTVEYFTQSFEMKYLIDPSTGLPPVKSPVDILLYKEYEPQWWVKISSTFVGEPEFPPSLWVIVVKLDLDKLYHHSLTPQDIALKIKSAFNDKYSIFECVASPIVFGQIDIYVNLVEISETSKAALGGDGVDDEGDVEAPTPLLNTDNIDYFTVRDVAISLIKKTLVSGVSNITKTFVKQDTKTKEWIVDTQGTNLIEILSSPGVDTTRTISDDMWEIYKIFGIEATRKFLIKEITKILSFDGTYINPRHICLLVDSMCKTGIITSVNRDGISRDVGPLAKSLFEKSVENCAESAAFAEHDIMKGVSSSVMMGTVPQVGTGTVEIRDEERIPVLK